MNDRLAKNVLALRRARGLSQGQLANASSVQRSTISTIENGTANPSLSSVYQLAYALGVSLEELLSSNGGQGIQFCLSKDLPFKILSDGVAFKTDLLPKQIPGLQFERVMLRPHGGFAGVPHVSGSWEYFTCTSGEVTVVIEGEEYRVRKGDVLSFPGNQKHAYRNTTPSNAEGISIVVLETRRSFPSE